jgi:YD repeat-containing protein
MRHVAISFHLHVIASTVAIWAGGCRDEVAPVVDDGPVTASETVVATPDSEAVARAAAFGVLPCDPLETLGALSAVAVSHGPIAARPGSGALVLARPDARVPLGPGSGELVLVRHFRHLPASAPGGPWSTWDLHFGLGPAADLCGRGAACDDGGRVLAFIEGGRRLDVRWQAGHPVAIGARGKELVTFAWKGDALESLSFDVGGGTARAMVRYGYDEAGRLQRVAGPSGAESMAYDAAGRPTRIGVQGPMALALGWDEEGRVTSIQGPGSAQTQLAYRHEATRRVVDVTRQGAVWRYVIEAVPGGTLVGWTNPAGHEETRRLDTRGQLVAAETADGPWRVARAATSGLLTGLEGPRRWAPVSTGRGPRFTRAERRRAGCMARRGCCANRQRPAAATRRGSGTSTGGSGASRPAVAGGGESGVGRRRAPGKRLPRLRNIDCFQTG